jgi:broad specificity phosphatase PhoE
MPKSREKGIATVILPEKIFIIRHAEKPREKGNSNLSTKGKHHAEMLATYMPKQVGNPDFLFAASNSAASKRPLQTLQPLARAIGLKINDNFGGGDYEELAEEILSRSRYAARTILICWRHESIPHLARKLLATDVPSRWRSNDFVSVWVIQYDMHCSGRITQIRQEF